MSGHAASVDGMSDTEPGLEESIRIARELQEAKTAALLGAVEKVAQAAHSAVAAAAEHREALKAFDAEWATRLRTAHTQHERAWQAALGAGWTAKELRHAQVPEPGRPAAKPRRKAAPTADPGPAGGVSE